MYFPNIYDLKYLIKDNENYQGGLNKIAKELKVERMGEMHQAGSDSQVTSDIFFELLKQEIVTQSDLEDKKNVIYGIGDGADDQETISYTSFAPGVDYNDLYQNIMNGFNLRSTEGNEKAFF